MSKYYILDEPTVYLSLVKARLPDGFEIEGPDHPRAVLIPEPTVSLIESVSAMLDGVDEPTQAQLLHQRRTQLALMIDRLEGDLSLCVLGLDAWPSVFVDGKFNTNAVTERADALLRLTQRDYVELMETFAKASSVSETESGNSDGG